MDLIKKENLIELSNSKDDVCLSFYIPTHRTGKETQQNAMRMGNLLSKADDLLEENDMDERERNKFLKPIHELIDNHEFWQHQSEGLAAFLNGDTLKTYRVPLNFEPTLVIGKYFYLKPLMPMISGNGTFFILALSQNEVRLLRATRSTIDDVILTDIPDSLEEMLEGDVFHEGQQFHSGTPTGQQGRAAIFHGHGGEEDDGKQILEYFRKIDEAVFRELKNENAPLILAGVEYLHAIYREANNYGNIVDEGITGNPEHMSSDELHETAWEIIKPYFRKSEDGAREDFHMKNGTGKASDKIHDVWNAAIQQKIESLFVDINKQEWGEIDKEKMEFTLYNGQKDSAVEILDYIATETMKSDGKIFAVPTEQMPTDHSVAAIYRY